MQPSRVQLVDLVDLGTDGLGRVLTQHDAVRLGDQDPRDSSPGNGVDVAVHRTLLVREVRHERTHGLGRDLGREVAENALGHSRQSDRGDGVHLDTVLDTLERQNPC